jgi:hypothetical protein
VRGNDQRRGVFCRTVYDPQREARMVELLAQRNLSSFLARRIRAAYTAGGPDRGLLRNQIIHS